MFKRITEYKYIVERIIKIRKLEYSDFNSIIEDALLGRLDAIWNQCNILERIWLETANYTLFND